MHLITRRALQEEDTSLTLIKAIRTTYLIILSLVVLSVGSLLMLIVSVATLFQARRFCAEVIAKWMSRTILWGVECGWKSSRILLSLRLRPFTQPITPPSWTSSYCAP